MLQHSHTIAVKRVTGLYALRGFCYTPLPPTELDLS